MFSLPIHATCTVIFFKHFMKLKFNVVIVYVYIRDYSLPFVTTSRVLFSLLGII